MGAVMDVEARKDVDAAIAPTWFNLDVLHSDSRNLGHKLAESPRSPILQLFH
jgi:hypothetical protein